MTANTAVVKNTAKNALKGNFVKTIFSCATLLFTLLISYYVAGLISIFAPYIYADIFRILFFGFVIYPLLVGILRFFWRLNSGVADNPISVFYYFSSKTLYFKVLKLLLCIISKLLPIAFLISLPAIFVWSLSQTYLFEYFGLSIPLWSRNLAYAIIFTKTLSISIIIVVSLRYYLAPILFIANENIDVTEAIHMSIIISKKSYVDLIYLIFSFIGWILISIFALPLVFTVPYMLMAYTVHSNFAITEYNEHIKNVKSSKYPSFTVGG